MSKFIMLMGLPASGKSTVSEDLSQQFNAEILSSDQLRKELYDNEGNQDNNQKVFEELNKRANRLLAEGKNVIYDSTNLNRKKRKHLINHVIKADEKIIFYLNTHFNTCLERDKNRSRVVGREVIERMYKNLHIPVLNEGWDEVNFIYENKMVLNVLHRYSLEEVLVKGLSHDELFEKLGLIIPEFNDILNLAQDSSYHSFSVSRHTYHVYKHILENYEGDIKTEMLWAGVFHDLGKAFCKSFFNYKGEEGKYANFLGHEYVSSQLAAFYLNQLTYSQEFINRVVNLVQFHMMPMKASDKKMKEIQVYIGEDLFDNLMFLHEADTLAK
jgi:predicted kinase